MPRSRHWILAAVAQTSGEAQLLHHDTLIEGSLPFALALALFLLAWQAMIAAMMLASGGTRRGTERPQAAWTVGCAALVELIELSSGGIPARSRAHRHSLVPRAAAAVRSV